MRRVVGGTKNVSRINFTAVELGATGYYKIMFV